VLSKTCPRPLSRGYQREERVEREITALLALPHGERLRRMTSRSTAPDEPSPECVVFYIRECLEHEDVDAAWAAATELARRMGRRITRRLAVWKGLSPYERDEVEEALLDRLYRVWLSREPAAEFWEVRFNLSLDRALADEIDRVLRRSQHETRLAPNPETDLDPWEIIPDTSAVSPEESALVSDALASLEEPLRTAFWLQCRQEWSEEEIATHLGCTSRTVRNYLRRARERLATWRGTGT
jgi:RNA polymerase sigma factor (sigma-70 family)